MQTCKREKEREKGDRDRELSECERERACVRERMHTKSYFGPWCAKDPACEHVKERERNETEIREWCVCVKEREKDCTQSVI